MVVVPPRQFFCRHSRSSRSRESISDQLKESHPMRRLTKILCDLLMIAGVFVSAFSIGSPPSFAQDSKLSEIALPPWLENLNLSSQQEQQTRAIVRDYDADIAAVWRQFSDSYQQGFKIEAVLLTAIEDNLTDAQRMQARDLRRKTAQREKSPASKSAGSDEGVATAGLALTPEQEAAADRINAKYLSRLRMLNRDIAGLHNRLVSLEADKIVEIEKILTKPQLQRLSEIRQDAPLPPLPTSKASTAAQNK